MNVEVDSEISSKPPHRFCTFRVVGARGRLPRLELGCLVRSQLRSFLQTQLNSNIHHGIAQLAQSLSFTGNIHVSPVTAKSCGVVWGLRLGVSRHSRTASLDEP